MNVGVGCSPRRAGLCSPVIGDRLGLLLPAVAEYIRLGSAPTIIGDTGIFASAQSLREPRLSTDICESVSAVAILSEPQPPRDHCLSLPNT